MKIGLIDVDSHNFPNLCLMKLSAYHKAKGHTVEWWNAKGRYDLVYKSRVFTDTYSKDTITVTNAEQVIFGGTGYDTKNRLPPEVEHSYPDYSIYPQFFGIAYGFLSRGCPRNCGFCIVSGKEGRKSVKVADLSEFWKWQPEIKIMDANLLACPDHENLIEQLIRSRAWVDFSQGLDIRLVNRDTATRAGIIEKLISAGFAERKGKKLIPTKDGYNLAAILPEVLTSPQLTAEWETRLTGIAKGSDSPDDFMRSIEEMTAGLVKTYSAISEDKAKLFTPQREAIGTCPRCGATVYEGKKNYYCSDRACSFVMWKNDLFFQQRKKTFTKAIAAALLKDGKVKIKGMYSTKTGKTFDGVVLLADTGGKYVNFRVEQNRK